MHQTGSTGDHQAQASEPQPKKRNTMVSFSEELDFELIQETHARNPYGEEFDKKTQAWSDVAEAMSVDVDSRRCRERCAQLLDAYESKQKVSEKRSGVTEEYTLKDQYLADLLEMRDTESLMKSDKKQQRDERLQEEEEAAAMRDAAMNGMTKGAAKSASQQLQLLAYLEVRDRTAHDIEERRVALEERKIAADERRLALEERRTEYQEYRMELERQERFALVDALKSLATQANTTN